MTPKEQIRQCVIELLELKNERTQVTDDESLTDGGLIDSVDVMALVSFVERTFGVDFSTQFFDPDDFDSIDGIHHLVIQSQATP